MIVKLDIDRMIKLIYFVFLKGEKDMLRILLVRHGESEADIEKRHEGRADFHLTDRGQLQAKLLAKYLKEKYQIDEIYCSPLKRAYSTAKKIGSEFGLELKVKDELMEIDNGLLAGLTFEDAKKSFHYR